MFHYLPPKPEKPLTEKIRQIFRRSKNRPQSQLDLARELFPSGPTLEQSEDVLRAVRRLVSWCELDVIDGDEHGAPTRVYKLRRGPS